MLLENDYHDDLLVFLNLEVVHGLVSDAPVPVYDLLFCLENTQSVKIPESWLLLPCLCNLEFPFLLTRHECSSGK